MKLSTSAFVLSLIFILSFSVAGFASEIPDYASYDQYLIKNLEDENIGIRTSAAQLLGERKVLVAVEPLVEMLKNEPHYCARIVAAMALYQIGDEQVLPILKERLRKDKCKTVKHVLAGIIQEMEETKLMVKK